MNTTLTDEQMLAITERAHHERNIVLRQIMVAIVHKPLEWMTQGVEILREALSMAPTPHPTETTRKHA
ncbi:hypothetical protein [Accumulibacter sp.]|uniref:hypothetical protein n=1 Tax=Accumulibacter sp. TaxID=2053492 RepID=UPI0028C3DA37|nr:hypothetical protein [Accumulibacter sp.]